MSEPEKPSPPSDPLDGFRDQRTQQRPNVLERLTGKKTPPDTGPLEPELL